jgi:hypothetical protein
MVKARRCLRRILIAVLLICGGAECAHAAPDEELLGKDLGYAVSTPMTLFSDERVRGGSFAILTVSCRVGGCSAPTALPGRAPGRREEVRDEQRRAVQRSLLG